MRQFKDKGWVRDERDFNYKMHRIDIITQKMHRIDIITQGASNASLAEGLREMAKEIKKAPEAQVLIAFDVTLTNTEWVIFAVLEDTEDPK